MDNIELMFISLATGSEVVPDSMHTVPIMLCDVGGHAITQHMPCQIIKTYNMISF